MGGNPPSSLESSTTAASTSILTSKPSSKTLPKKKKRLTMSLHVLTTTVKGKVACANTYDLDLTGKTVIITGAVSSR